MIVHNFDPILIDFGLFQIRWYSVAYILGILIGWSYANKIISLRHDYMKMKNLKKDLRLDWFLNNTGDNCYIRGIFKKN